MKRFITVALCAAVLMLVGCGADVSSVSSEVQSAPYYEKSCKELANVALSAVEFPDMAEVTDEVMLETIMDFKTDGITDYCVYQQMISVHLNEIIVIRCDNPDEILSLLDKRKETLIEQLSFYPDQQESAKATVTGKKGSVCYLITHTEAKQAEKALVEALG